MDSAGGQAQSWPDRTVLLLAVAAAAVILRGSLTGCKMLCRVLLPLQWGCASQLPLLLQGLVFGVAVMGGTIKLFDSRNYQQGPFDAFGVSQGLMYLVGEEPAKSSLLCCSVCDGCLCVATGICFL